MFAHQNRQFISQTGTEVSSYPFCLCKYKFPQAQQLCLPCDYFHKVADRSLKETCLMIMLRERFWGIGLCQYKKGKDSLTALRLTTGAVQNLYCEI